MEITQFADLAKFDKNNAYSLLNLGFAVTNWSVTKKDSDLPEIKDFKLVKTFTCYDEWGFTYRKYGVLYYSEALNMIVISFSGTTFISEWIDDFDFLQTNPIEITSDREIWVHSGFYDIYKSFREDLMNTINKIKNENTVVVCSGHSLGGGVVSICFFDLIVNNVIDKKTLYSFGAPRVGNTKFADIVNRENTIMRVVNTADLAPTVPPAIIEKYIYTHSQGLVSFTINLETYTLNHGDAYTKFFE